MLSLTEIIVALAVVFVTYILLPLRLTGILASQYLRKRSLVSALFSKRFLGAYFVTVVLSFALEFALVYVIGDKLRDPEHQTG